MFFELVRKNTLLERFIDDTSDWFNQDVETTLQQASGKWIKITLGAF